MDRRNIFFVFSFSFLIFLVNRVVGLTALIKSGGKVVWFGTKPDIYHKYRIRVLAGYLSGNHALLPQPLTLVYSHTQLSTLL